MRHWIFDLDGTLVDSFAHYFAALDTVFREHGARFAPELRRVALTETLELFFERHLGTPAVAPAFERLQSLSNEDARSIRAFEGIDDLIIRLKASGARVGVWTNRDRVSAGLILEHSGLARHFDEASFVSGTCVTRRKPDPEGLLRLIARFGCAPSEVTMVGDHEHDVIAAKAAGTRGVRASWHAYWDESDCAIADAQFRRVREFSGWALSPASAPRCLP